MQYLCFLVCILASVSFKIEMHFFCFIFKCFFKTQFYLSYIYAILMVAIIWFAFAHLVWIVLCVLSFSICTYEE